METLTKIGFVSNKELKETLFINDTGQFLLKTIRIADPTCSRQGMLSTKEANQWRAVKLKGQEQIDSYSKDYLRIMSQLKVARLNMGLSQKELGTKVGLWQCQVSAYETGTQAMSIQKLFVFCTALNVKPESLIMGLIVLDTQLVCK